MIWIDGRSKEREAYYKGRHDAVWQGDRRLAKADLEMLREERLKQLKVLEWMNIGRVANVDSAETAI